MSLVYGHKWFSLMMSYTGSQDQILLADGHPQKIKNKFKSKL